MKRISTDYKVVDYEQLLQDINKKRSGKKIVVATGVFDLLHVGHLAFLDFAKSQGDYLIVGVATDMTVKTIKGVERPIISENQRVHLIAGLEIVDFVVLLQEELIDQVDNRLLIEKIKPEIWVVSEKDYMNDENKKLASLFGIKLVKNKRIKPYEIKFTLSTSEIIKSLN